LRGYLATLQDVENRYVKDRNNYHPADGDIQRIEQTTLELVDLFNDRVSTAQYAKMVQRAYAEGVNNMANYPSLSCVRTLATIVTAAITRIIERPELLDPPPVESKFTAPAVLDQSALTKREWPEKITMEWLYEEMPASIWKRLGIAIVTAFIVGLTIGTIFPIPTHWLLDLYARLKGQ
jgi:hypothetical protein